MVYYREYVLYKEGGESCWLQTRARRRKQKLYITRETEVGYPREDKTDCPQVAE